MLRITQLVFVIVLALNQVKTNDPQKIVITVYYESKCSDSKTFIIKQLQPTVNLLHQYLMLKLVPFGKASSINNGYDGFKCQHGPSECAGNMVQGCALDLMQGRDDVEKVSYVACEMQTEAGTRGDMKCVHNAGLNSEEVQRCAASEKGIALQLEQEYLTKLVKPNFIPTITINGVFNQEIQNSAQEDLTGTLCSIFSDIPPCALNNNSNAMKYILY